MLHDHNVKCGHAMQTDTALARLLGHPEEYKSMPGSGFSSPLCSNEHVAIAISL